MEVIEFPNVPKEPISREGYQPTQEELKLLSWVRNRKAFNSTTRVAIRSFILRESYATLRDLTVTQLDSLKQEARNLGVSLEH